MVQLLQSLGLVLSTACILVSAAPATSLQKRSCTFTTAAAAKSGKTSCSAIILSGITVPAGTTLDLTGLTSGTTVSQALGERSCTVVNTSQVEFEGTTTWDYEEWSGPLFSVSGTDITVTGASGHELNGNGAKWWVSKS